MSLMRRRGAGSLLIVLLVLTLPAGPAPVQAQAQEPIMSPDAERAVFADGAVSVAIPDGWTVLRLDFTDDEQILGGLRGPGATQLCTFSRLPFEGRVSLGFIEELVDLAPDDRFDRTGRARVASVDAFVGLWQNGFADIEGLPGWHARYLVPWGAAGLRFECSLLLDEEDPAEPDWAMLASTIELAPITARGLAAAHARRARDTLCRVVVPAPQGQRAARRVHQAIPRATVADVRRAVRRFFDRHGPAVLGVEAPETARPLGDGAEWFDGPLSRRSVNARVDRLTDASTLAPTVDLVSTFAWVSGAFDDRRLRADARRVAALVYRQTATAPRPRVRGTWRWLNERIEQQLWWHYLDPCER